MRPKSEKCLICSTTETPLWRMGPDMKRSLCNACGIRWRKTAEAEAIYSALKAKKGVRTNSSANHASKNTNTGQSGVASLVAIVSSQKNWKPEPKIRKPGYRKNKNNETVLIAAGLSSSTTLKREVDDNVILENVRRKIRKYDESLAVKLLAEMKCWTPKNEHGVKELQSIKGQLFAMIMQKNSEGTLSGSLKAQRPLMADRAGVLISGSSLSSTRCAV